ncbi:MAG: hypothetical protein N2171_02340 [Clostridia bacterium]|nr:hypothetical protein [Clostridia bacterium]
MSRKLSHSELIFLVLAVFVCIYTIFFPPVAGVADQGDFERVMQQAGLDYMENHSFYEYVEPLYKMKFTNPLFLIGLIPSTSYIYPIFIAKIISHLLLRQYFDTRILAIVMCAIYISCCFVIFRAVKIKNQFLKILFAVLFIAVFFDGVNLTMFNSMYGQSMLLISLSMFIAACVLIIENWERLKKRYIVFLFAASIFLLGAKLQCFVLLPFVFAVFIYIFKKKSEYRRLICVFLCLLLWYTAGNYVLHSIMLNHDTQYNSVFYGILKDSENPAEDLKALGLNPDMAVDAGKHAYLDLGEYVYPPRTNIMQEEFYDKMNNVKLVKFYISHPARLAKAMEITAKNAFYTYIDLGTFEENSGKAPLESDYRFDAWSSIRNHFPKTLLFIIPMYTLFFVLGICEYRRHKNKYALVFLIVVCMGLIQFPMPYIGNGNADIVKQLYLFNITFDIGVFSVVCMIERKLIIWIKKRRL